MSFVTRTIAALLLLLAGSSCALGQGMTPFVEGLYWQVSEETSSVWASVVSPNPLNGPATNSTFEAAQNDFDWQPGLRAGFEFQGCCSPWQLRTYWTHLQTEQYDEIPPGDHLVVPEFFSGFLSGEAFTFTSATLDWDFEYNTIDFELGREFCCGPGLCLRPWVGLKLAYIDQTMFATYSEDAGLAATERVTQDYWGVGMTFGLGGEYVVPCTRWKLVGAVSGTFLHGTWNVDDTFERTDTSPSLFTYDVISTQLNESSLGTLMVSYFAGAEWRYCRDSAVVLRAGYEMQWWANQQRAVTFQQLPMHGDLTIQGFTCGLYYSY